MYEQLGFASHEERLAFYWRLGKNLAIAYRETNGDKHLCITMIEQVYRENRRLGLKEGLGYDDELFPIKIPLPACFFFFF